MGASISETQLVDQRRLLDAQTDERFPKHIWSGRLCYMNLLTTSAQSCGPGVHVGSLKLCKLDQASEPAQAVGSFRTTAVGPSWGNANAD